MKATGEMVDALYSTRTLHFVEWRWSGAVAFPFLLEVVEEEVHG